jgi:polysaccharide biosynthesis/export protein
MWLRGLLAFSLIILALPGCTRRQPVPAVVAVAPEPVAYASIKEPAYRLDSGDRLRVIVFGQEGLTSTYVVDDGGRITLPLIGAVPARGMTTGEISQSITSRLRQGYIREPHVAVEVEAHRPFFILGEVANPGQYPYVAHMTAETAVAIAGGFTPRAYKNRVQLSRAHGGEVMRGAIPLTYPIAPGDTINVGERWF